MWKQQLGAQLKQRRNVLHITQPHLAELAGISVNTLYKIERGEGNPTIDVLEKITEVLGLQLTLAIRKTD